jgi:hypothetical protein
MRSCAERVAVTNDASSVSVSTETKTGPTDRAAQATRSVIQTGIAAVYTAPSHRPTISKKVCRSAVSVCAAFRTRLPTPMPCDKSVCPRPFRRGPIAGGCAGTSASTCGEGVAGQRPDCGLSDELTCRRVRVVVPTDGLLTMSCDPRGDDRGGFGLTIVGYNEPTGSGLPWHVNAGTELAMDIGMWFQSTVSQSCVFKTSLTR